jgi:hypothetical protein
MSVETEENYEKPHTGQAVSEPEEKQKHDRL